jgi:pseudouridine kinase
VEKVKKVTDLYYDDLENLDKRVLVIGAAGLDLVGRLDEMPEPGVSTPANVRPSFGGVARNVAENLARLGQTVSLITAVGNDEFGEQLLAHAIKAGVDTSACLKTNKFYTSSYLAVLMDNAQLHFALDDMRAISTITPDYLRLHADLFRNSELVFIDTNLSPESIKTVFDLARLSKIPVCADATSTKLSNRLKPYLSKLKLITANNVEAAKLCGNNELEDIPLNDQASTQQLARKLINQGAEIAVVPMAEFGVCYATSETSGHVPAIKTKTLDPTGAGDALSAALIFGLLNDIPIDDTLRIGVSAASLTLRYPGTVLPDLSLEKIYDELVI